MNASVFYASNKQIAMFPNNTWSQYRSYINPIDLDYISSEESIEVAVKSITLDNDIHANTSLALKSTLSEQTISSCGYDNIIALFSTTSENKGINIFRFENPVFFPTTDYRLCNAVFTNLNFPKLLK